MSATVPMSCEAASEGSADGYWPDLDYIRRRISIRHVARELGLEVFGNSARCWRTDGHQNNDRSPSLSFTRRNRARCQVCDDSPMSTLDLVKAVRGCDLRAAVEWITARWDVPQVKKGKHVNRREPNYPRLRVLTNGSPFEYWVRTGFWASLSKSARSVLVAIFGLSDVDTHTAQPSFRALRSHAGVSFRGVAKGIQELEGVGLLQVDRTFNRTTRRKRPLNAYKLCPQAPEFLENLSLIHQRHSAEIQLEKEFQKERRRSQKSRRTNTLGTYLSPRESTRQIHALTKRARDCSTGQGGNGQSYKPGHANKEASKELERLHL